VASNHRRLDAESVKQAHYVTHEVQERVLIDLFWTIGLTIAAHVGRDHVEPGIRKRCELMAPGVPGFGKAVTEENERPRALLGHMHTNAVRFDGAMCYLRHRCLQTPLVSQPTSSVVIALSFLGVGSDTGKHTRHQSIAKADNELDATVTRD
jgi:hypothetical protein